MYHDQILFYKFPLWIREINKLPKISIKTINSTAIRLALVAISIVVKTIKP